MTRLHSTPWGGECTADAQEKPPGQSWGSIKRGADGSRAWGHRQQLRDHLHRQAGGLFLSVRLSVRLSVHLSVQLEPSGYLGGQGGGEECFTWTWGPRGPGAPQCSCPAGPLRQGEVFSARGERCGGSTGRNCRQNQKYLSEHLTT